MSDESGAGKERGCVVELINGCSPFLIQSCGCWFHYRDGTSSLDDRPNTPIPPGHSVEFTSPHPDLCVEMVVVVVQVCLPREHEMQCMRGHDFQQAWPGRCLHHCTFAVKPAPGAELSEGSPQFVLGKVEPTSGPYG